MSVGRFVKRERIVPIGLPAVVVVTALLVGRAYGTLPDGPLVVFLVAGVALAAGLTITGAVDRLRP